MSVSSKVEFLGGKEFKCPYCGRPIGLCYVKYSQLSKKQQEEDPWVALLEK